MRTILEEVLLNMEEEMAAQDVIVAVSALLAHFAFNLKNVLMYFLHFFQQVARCSDRKR